MDLSEKHHLQAHARLDLWPDDAVTRHVRLVLDANQDRRAQRRELLARNEPPELRVVTNPDKPKEPKR